MVSLKAAYEGLRPPWTLNGVDIPKQHQNLPKRLRRRHTVTEFKGDWEWHGAVWQLRTCYRNKNICHLCRAAKNSTNGTPYTMFGASFHRRSPAEFLMVSLPPRPCPLILLPGFDSQQIRYCSMHTLNLGVFQSLAAEGLLHMCENECLGAGADLTHQLCLTFLDFKRWQTREGISCSGREFSVKRLHVCNTDYPFLGYKAFNTRIVIAYLAASRTHCVITFSLILNTYSLDIFELCYL